jgi:hypothetical protein
LLDGNGGVLQFRHIQEAEYAKEDDAHDEAPEDDGPFDEKFS